MTIRFLLRTNLAIVFMLGGAGTINAASLSIEPRGESARASTSCSVPNPVSGLIFGSNKQTMSWNAAGGATNYDVVRGSLSALPVGPHDGDELCIDDVLATSATDAALPAPGSGYSYLVRGENACTSGTFGKTSEGYPRFTTTCVPVAPPDPDAFLYVAGHWTGIGNPTLGSMTFDGITLTKNLESMSIWLTKINLATRLSVWATKIVEGQDAAAGANIFGPFIASDRATGDIYVQIGDVNRTNGNLATRPLTLYDGTSDVVPKATLYLSQDRQQWIIKYNKDGAFQWVRTFRFGTSVSSNSGLSVEVYKPNIAVLPNGNIVVGIYSDMAAGPHVLSLNDESMNGTNFTAVASFGGIGQRAGQGALVVLDSGGNFVASTLSEVAASGGGGYCHLAPIQALSRYTAHGIASGMEEYQGGGASITAQFDGGTFTNTHTPVSNEAKTVPTKYDTSLGFQWSADDTEEPSGNSANSLQIQAIELGNDGSVYTVGLANANTTPASVSSRSAGWAAPQATVVHQVESGGATQPWYNKRSPSGAIEWSKGFLAGSTLGNPHGRIDDIAVVGGVPWIIGYQRTLDIIKIDGLPDMDSANAPGKRVRGWLVKLDPTTGVAADASKIFTAETDNEDPWLENETAAIRRLIPLDTTRLAVGLDSIRHASSIVLGRGEGGETTFTAPASRSVGTIAVYDAVSGGLYYVKSVPTSQDGPTTRVVALAGSEQ